MQFPTLPPEINTLRMLSGAGSGPMLQAAQAWQSLGNSLRSASSSFQNVTSNLAGGAWQGAAAQAMAQAAAPYVAWLTAAATHSETAALQSQLVASAFEAARAMTVPLQSISGNRNSFISAIRANIFGQLTPAIMALEGMYEEMWAQDVSAIAGYHAGASSSAGALAPLGQLMSNSARNAGRCIRGSSASSVIGGSRADGRRANVRGLAAGGRRSVRRGSVSTRGRCGRGTRVGCGLLGSAGRCGSRTSCRFPGGRGRCGAGCRGTRGSFAIRGSHGPRRSYGSNDGRASCVTSKQPWGIRAGRNQRTTRAGSGRCATRASCRRSGRGAGSAAGRSAHRVRTGCCGSVGGGASGAETKSGARLRRGKDAGRGTATHSRNHSNRLVEPRTGALVRPPNRLAP